MTIRSLARHFSMIRGGRGAEATPRSSHDRQARFSRFVTSTIHIAGVRADPEAARGWYHGIRLPGTNVPGVITAGTFYQDGKRVFWDVHRPEKTIVIGTHPDAE